MKQSQELIGMPIISIMDGKEIGKVKSLLVNPESGMVEFFIIHNERWTLGMKVLPFAHVKGIGDYAVMTESESVVIDLSEDALASELKAKGIQIIDSKVITTAGQFLGKITEYYVNKENGKIEACVVEDKGREGVLAAEFIITVGKEILVVKEEGSKNLLDKQQFAGGADTAVLLEDEPVKEGKSLPIFQDTPDLTGKRIVADLYDEQGALLLAEGEVITSEVMERVKQMGRDKLVELTLKVAE